MKHIVVFASGSGTNFQAIIDAVESGQIQATIRGLIANKPGIKALKRAKKNDIETRVMPPSAFNNKAAYKSELLQTLKNWQTDLIVLAGYMLKIPTSVIQQYEHRIINIHPSLLPKYGGKGFYGIKVHEAVLANNEHVTGCTVHYVTEEYDEGPIIDQIEVPVKESDTAKKLADRVLEQESTSCCQES
ncbi:MAG: phosphoribosylglycinamide formyltransferase [Balneolaceae bacterium]|nr:phosphoribosylglycinamide formyltransferase [Balneolaceae bacterium]